MNTILNFIDYGLAHNGFYWGAGIIALIFLPILMFSDCLVEAVERLERWIDHRKETNRKRAPYKIDKPLIFDLHRPEIQKGPQIKIERGRIERGGE